MGLRRRQEARLRRPQEARLRRPQEARLRRPQEAWVWQQEARLQRQEAWLGPQEARLRRQEVWHLKRGEADFLARLRILEATTHTGNMLQRPRKIHYTCKARICLYRIWLENAF